MIARKRNQNESISALSLDVVVNKLTQVSVSSALCFAVEAQEARCGMKFVGVSRLVGLQ